MRTNKDRRRSALALVYLLAASPTAFAQQTAPPPPSQATPPPAPSTPAEEAPAEFDVDRTVRAALANSTALRNALRQVAIDERRAGAASAQGRPAITGSARATRFDQATTVAFSPDSPPVEVLPDHMEELVLGVTQRLDLTGQIRAATSEARLQALADRFRADAIAQSEALRARVAYYDLLRAEHQVQVAEANLRAARAQSATARRLYEAQVGQKLDLLRAVTQEAQAEQEVARARNDRDNARSAFNDLVGRPLATPVRLADVPGVSVGTDLPANALENAPVGAASLPFTPFTPPIADVERIDLDRDIREAQSRRAEALRSEVLVRVAETGVKIARGGQEPEVSVSATGSYFPTTSLQAPRQRTAGISAALTIPLYDGGATRERVAEARLRTESARADHDRVRDDIALEVRQAHRNLLTAARQIAAANTALEQATAARQLAQIRYEGQVGLFLEVTDAQAALVRAESDQVNAVYAYLIARARYESALGLAPLTGTPTPGTSETGATPDRGAEVIRGEDRGNG